MTQLEGISEQLEKKIPSSASHRYLSLMGFEDCVSYATHTMFLVAVLYSFLFIFFLKHSIAMAILWALREENKSLPSMYVPSFLQTS